MALSGCVVWVLLLHLSVSFTDATVTNSGSPVSTTEGNTISPFCDVTGGETFVGWYDQKGNKISTDPNGRLHVESSGSRHTLVMKQIDPALDGGEYVCKGNTNEAVLVVNIGFVATPPLVQKLEVGKSGKIKYNAHGYPTPTYKYKKDGQEFKPIDEPRFTQLEDGSLKISKVEIADGGDYACTITQGIAERVVTIKVTVFQKPKITVRPQASRALSVGYNTTFKCNATGIPEPTIKWVDQNGRVIDSVVNSRYSLSGGHLTITRVEQKDTQKTYTCEAINKEGEDTARAEISRIWVPAKLSPVDDLRRVAGEKAILQCVASAGDEPVTVVWKKDGIKFEDQVQASGRSTITFEKVDAGNMGSYVCEATNGAVDDKGKIITATEEAYLFVQSPPQLNKQKSGTPIYSYVGNTDSVQIVCEFNGFPFPNITMSSNGTLIAEGQTTVTHEITDTKENSFGKFQCFASNKYGNASHTVELKTAVAPDKPKNLKSVGTCKSIRVKWEEPFSGGMPIIDYVVKITDKNGSEISSYTVAAPKTEYNQLQKIEAEKTYKVEVFARSSFKKGPIETEMVTTTKYCAPGIPVVTNNEKKLHKLKLKLKWQKPTYDGGDADIKYRVSYESYKDGLLVANKTIATTDQTQMEIDEEVLVAGLTYTFKVTPINAGGDGEPASFRVTVSEDANEPKVGARKEDGLSSGVIAAIIIVVILIVIIIIDMICCYFNGCGVLFCCHKTCCGGGGGSSAKYDDGKKVKSAEMEKLKPAPENV